MVQCIGADSILLMIDSAEIQSAVIRHLRDEIGVLPPETWENAIAPGYWVGGSEVLNNTWHWIDGTRIPTKLNPIGGFENWYDKSGYNEPNGPTRGHNCLYVSGRVDEENLPQSLGAWFDDACSARKYFICQAPAQPQGKFFPPNIELLHFQNIAYKDQWCNR